MVLIFLNVPKFSKFLKLSNFKIFKFQNFKKYSEIRGATSISDAFISFPILGVLDVSKSIVKLGGFAVAANKLWALTVVTGESPLTDNALNLL